MSIDKLEQISYLLRVEIEKMDNLSMDVNVFLQVTSCPNCHKPLPRCAVCLINMGSQSSYFGPESVSNLTQTIKSAEFSVWFTWCQTCRHGGHAEHLLDWFK